MGSLRFLLTNPIDLFQYEKGGRNIIGDSVNTPIGAANTDRGFILFSLSHSVPSGIPFFL